MVFSLTFVERRDPETGSLERVFERIASFLRSEGIDIRFEKAAYPNSWWGMLRNALFFRPGKSDLYHITGHIHYMAYFLPGNKTILTIHDLIVLKSRTGLRKYLIKKLLFDYPVRRARYVTVISEKTKQELLKNTGCEESRIRVIENPLTRQYAAMPNFGVKKPCPDILQIGTAPHKNLATVVRALQGYRCNLTVIGKLSKNDYGLLTENCINYRNIEVATESQIEEAYRNADVVTFCSTDEGFGLPVLEAQAMGVPLVTSNISPIKETAGAGALLVDPLDREQIRSAIETVWSDHELRAALIAKGFENVKKYSVEKIAEKYLGLYKEALSGSSGKE